MRIAELSREGSVPIPTIKYYLREGLLPAGEATAPNQAEYGELHVRRLRLIRALTQVGGLSLRAVRSVLDAVDDEHVTMHDLLGVAHHALAPVGERREAGEEGEAAREEVDRLLGKLGWRVSASAPGRHALVEALMALRRLGRKADATVLQRYARVADRIAAWEIEQVGSADSRTDAVEGVVVGTVVFERVLTALRRLAQEHHSSVRFTAGRSGSTT